ncbi:hydroxymethylpyrimidine/phosphomethylpyrimidine kinase [Kineothrix alysoides]|uniref:Hydroxymethylpyrimidine/phosphomethylpyrimidine kinase n=1 Tax=Kineothrix alysoides TaxID=1469948 RepID=A0A4R1QZG6_9FIRM|nr:bifunctional hydroxymethylpyrimidine kinase/phosphomethylpyrimidine kinase [Kineothrix alysoides]TCL58378.1 hydroxymethylpyrimidine/phosphomethylpyrimidine kinase [Kineothrix alysoides]
MKKVLSIAGSDCSGGAGIQADLKTFSAHGVFGMTVIASVVAENTFRVIEYQDIRPDIIEKQIDAVFEDIPPDALKIGMLSCKEGMLAVAGKLREWKPVNVVIDPVMYAKNGCALMDPDSIDTLIAEVVPLADVITPNIPEAEKMAGMSVHTQEDMKKAARIIHDMGCRAVLVKGGHSEGDATDILFDGSEFYCFSAPRIQTKNTHGTGCTYSSAIASNLALELPIRQAVARSKQYVTTAIAHSLEIGKGNGPTDHFYDLFQNGLSDVRRWMEDF